MKRWGRAGGGFLFGLVLWSGMTLGGVDHAEGKGRLNILLITVDCLRPDHMGLYGYDRDTTPHIDGFFRRAFRFPAYAQASWTSPGVVSLLTGLSPPVHGMDLKGKQTSPWADLPLKRLQQAGYTTLGYVRDDNYSHLGWSGQVPRGKLIETLESLRDRPFFIWYHYRGPHLPYRPPEPYRSRWFGAVPAPSSEALQAVSRGEMLPRGSARLTAADAPAIRALYDGEVAAQDAELAGLFDYLRESGLAGRTVVVLSADHGEELMEHGWVGHASTSLDATVYEEVVRIPLLIRIPGLEGGWVPGVTAQQMDLVPTLFDILGLEPPEVQGKSLLPWIQGRGEETEPEVFIETSPCGWQCPPSRFRERLAALRAGPWKLIEKRAGAQPEFTLYHLQADPAEREDQSRRRPEVLRTLKKRLAALRQEYLERAFRRARGLARAHLTAAREHLQQGKPARAAEELQAVRRLDRVYRLENPAFPEEGSSAMRRAWRRVLEEAAALERRNPENTGGSHD